MTAQSVNPPFPIFNDVDGNPLEDGFIYIGIENLNPETNLISVYWDSALTIPAAQPIRTLGGYPSRAGTPARIFADSNYSITVRNKNGTFIYSSASMTDIFSAELVYFVQSGTGAVARTAQEKMRDAVCIFDFMTAAEIADVQSNTGSLDVTAAFVSAQAAHKNIHMPAGTYLLDNLRIQNRISLIGDGYAATIIKQKTTGNPAINVTSDVTTGQLQGLNLSKFGVIGATSATVAAVLFSATGVYAIWRSKFDFTADSVFRAFEIQAISANNVFECDFKVISESSLSTAVLINGGTYNNFDLFLTNTVSGTALDSTSFHCNFNRCVTDGTIFERGQSNTYLTPTVEQFFGATIPLGCAIGNLGFNNVFISPTVNLNTTNSAKITAALLPFSGDVWINPQLLCTVANPFELSHFKFSIIGPGANGCTNKMEVLWIDFNATNSNLRNVSFIGDCSAFWSGWAPNDGKTIQYLAPTGNFNFQVLNNTGAVIWEPTGTLAFSIVSLPYFPTDNQVITFSSTETITTLYFSGTPAGCDITLIPTTIVANTQFSIIYRATNNKYYRVG